VFEGAGETGEQVGQRSKGDKGGRWGRGSRVCVSAGAGTEGGEGQGAGGMLGWEGVGVGCGEQEHGGALGRGGGVATHRW
jgi:hypothetical protein